MMKLGVVWVRLCYFCPMLARGVEYKDLDDTPLKSLQMHKIALENDLFAI